MPEQTVAPVPRTSTVVPTVSFIVVVLAFVIGPELRRVNALLGGPLYVDQALSFLPLVLALLLFGRAILRRSDTQTRAVEYLIVSACGVSLFWSLAVGRGLSAFYASLDLSIPVLGALAYVMMQRDGRRVYDRIVAILLSACALVSVYAITQWWILPPWDARWISSGVVVGVGFASPLAFRVFGTLNSPGFYAAFIVVVLVLSIPLIRKRGVALALLFLPCAAGLALTYGRAAWLCGALSLIVYLALCSRPLQTLLGYVLAAVVVVSGGLAIDHTVADGRILASLGERAATFSHLSRDVSALERSEQTSNAFERLAHDPLGDGVGRFDGAALLRSPSEDIESLDNGVLARLVEMGWAPGVAFFAAYLLIALRLVVAWRAAVRAAQPDRRDRAAAAVAALTAMFAMMLFADVLRGTIAFALTAACFACVERVPHAAAARRSAISNGASLGDASLT